MALRGSAVSVSTGYDSTRVITVSSLGIQVGDLIRLLISSGGGYTNTFTCPGFSSGSTVGLPNQGVTNTNTMGMLWKVATYADTVAGGTSSFTITFSTTNRQVVVCKVNSGRDTVNPFRSVASTSNDFNQTSPYTKSFTGVAALAGDDVDVFMACRFFDGTNAPTFTTPVGYANALTTYATATQYSPIARTFDRVNAPSGTTGTLSVTETVPGATDLGTAGYVVALASAGTANSSLGLASAGASASGDLTIGALLTGAATAVSSNGAALFNGALFSSNASGVASAPANLSLAQAFIAVGGDVASGSGNITAGIQFSGSPAALASASGVITTLGAYLVGGAGGLSTVKGAITLGGATIGFSRNVASASASLRVGASLIGAASGIASVNGLVINTSMYAASTSVASAAGGALLVSGINLVAPGNSIASGLATLLAGIMVVGASAAGATASGFLSTSGTLSYANATSGASASGTLTVGAGLRGAASATTYATGLFAGPAAFAANGSGVASSSGVLSTASFLSGASSALVRGAAPLKTSSQSGLAFGVSDAQHANGNAQNIATFSKTTQASGSAFLIGLICRTGVGGLVADSYNNNYTQIGTTQIYAGGTMSAALYLCANGRGGANHSAYASQSTFNDMSIFFQEILTNGLGVAIDQYSVVLDSASPFVSGTIATNQAQEIALSFFAGCSATNPATLTVSAPFNLQATKIDGSTGNEAIGGFATTVTNAVQASLSTTFTQAGNTTGSALFLVGLVPVGNLFGNASAVVSAPSALTVTGVLPSASASGYAGAYGALTNFSSVVLTSSIGGVGSIYDPYFWTTELPIIGNTVFFDPTILVKANGEIISNTNNIFAQVQFRDAAGTISVGLIQTTTGQATYAYAQTTAAGYLTTRPSVFAGIGAAVASASGNLSTGIPLGGTSATLVNAGADIVTGIGLRGFAGAVAFVGIPALGAAPTFNASLGAVVSAAGNLTLTATLYGAAQAVTASSGVLSHGAVLTGPSAAIAKGSGAVLVAIRAVGRASDGVGARGAILTAIRPLGRSSGVSRASGALTTGARFGGASRATARAVSSLSIGSGFTGAAGVVSGATAALRRGVTFAGASFATVNASSVSPLIVAVGFEGHATAVAYVDPELTTDQSPLGMYKGDPNYVVGSTKFFQQPIFNIIGPTEQRVLTFDFSSDLLNGELLAGVATATIEVTAGADLQLMSIISGLLSFDLGFTRVMVPVNAANGMASCDYYITVRSPTTNPQKTLDRFGLLQIRG